MATAPFEPGTLVLISSGEYSDYQVHALVRVLKRIGPDVWQEYMDACTEDTPKWGRVARKSALPWLIEQGFVEEVENREMWVECYDRPSPWGDL